MPSLKNLQAPAAAGAMVGIIDLLAQCSLLGPEERDPMQWNLQVHISSTKRRLDLDQGIA